MRGVSPVCVYRAWTPSLADRRMPFRFFYVYWLGVGHKRKQSLNCLSNTPKLFDLNELLSSLKITPGQMGNMKGLIYIEGLTEKQVRQRLSHAKIIRTNKFGVNSCLYYIFFEDVKGRYLCLFNGDRECFRALFFSKVLLN